MWTLKKLVSIKLPLGLIGEVVRLANESREAGKYLVRQWQGFVIATQNPGGKSLSAKLVKTCRLQCWQVVWVFKEEGGRRKWLYYFLLDPDNFVIWVGRPTDQESILRNVIGDDQLSLF